MGRSVERMREWRQKNPGREAAVRRTRYYRLRDAAVFAAGGWCCACCAEKRRSMLQIDHINGGEGQHRKKRSGYEWYRDVVAQPHDYQILCANCNHSKRILGECEHKCPKKEFTQKIS